MDNNNLIGKINRCDVLMITAYGVAVKNGFEGTEEEWLESLKGDAGAQGPKGDKGDSPVKGVDYFTDVEKVEMVQAVVAQLPVYDGSVSDVVYDGTIEVS